MKKLLPILLLVFAAVLCADDLSFADSLYCHGEYYRAITEYYRGMFSDGDRDYCHAQIRNCYQEGGDYEGLIGYLEGSMDREDRLYVALANLKNDRPDIASIVSDDPLDPAKSLIYSLSEAYRGRYQGAGQRLDKITDPAFEGIRDEVARIVEENKGLDFRSPLLAGILGIVPGLGYAYTGAWQTALSSLLANAILLGAAYELMGQELYFSAASVGAVGLGFYLGNIYGSANSAAKRNRTLRKQHLDKYLDGVFLEILKAR
jgi:hypothetical protein